MHTSKHPKSSRARFLKSLILAKLNRTHEAIDLLTGLSEEFPELPEPHNNLAVLYASQGQYDDARRELEMAVRAYPNYAIAYQNLGDVYAALAAQAYEKALHLDAKSDAARARLEEIRAMLPAGAVAAAPLAAAPSQTARRRAPSAPPAAEPPAGGYGNHAGDCGRTPGTTAAVNSSGAPSAAATPCRRSSR